MTAFSCRSRSLATLSKPASSCRPCRSEASFEGKSESQVAVEGMRPRAWAYETNWDLMGPAQPPRPLPCPVPTIPFTAQTMGQAPPPCPPTAWASGPSTHLQGSLPSAPRAAAGAHFCSRLPSAARCGTGCPSCESRKGLQTQGSPPPLHPQTRAPRFWLGGLPRGGRWLIKSFEKLNHDIQKGFAETLVLSVAPGFRWTPSFLSFSPLHSKPCYLKVSRLFFRLPHQDVSPEEAVHSGCPINTC